MRDEIFLTGVIGENDFELLTRIAKAPGLPFHELVATAGLDPSRELRHSDLANIDLTDADLRGFDFTGSDLRGAVGIRVRWDSTTVFEAAEVDNSIFAARIKLDRFFDSNERARNLLDVVSRGGWFEQATWAAQNLRDYAKYRDIALPIIEALLYRATDTWLNSELLRLLAPRIGSRRALRDMLLTAIADHPDSTTVVRAGFRLFRSHRLARDSAVRRLALILTMSPQSTIQTEAIQFLMRTVPTPDEVEIIQSLAEDHPHTVGSIFVAEAVRNRETYFDLVTRDPITNETFGLYPDTWPSLAWLIARKWHRAELNGDVPRLSELELPRSRRTDAEQIADRAHLVRDIWREMEEFGFKVRWVPNPLSDPIKFRFSSGALQPSAPIPREGTGA